MKIQYMGADKERDAERCAVISARGKEEALIDRVADELEKAGFKVVRCGYGVGNDKELDYHIGVYDKEEYEEVKEIYKAAKKGA